jgi:sulfonate transport system substrate-binding protein
VSTPRHRRLWLLVPATSLVLAAAACGGDDDSGSASAGADPDATLEIPTDVHLTVGDQSQQIELPLRLAGELADVPYEVTFANFASGPLVNEAIAAGEIDLGTMGDTPALLSYASGLDTVVAAVRVTAGSGASIVAAEDSGITSLADLSGKRIAYTTGTNTHGLVLRSLDSVGLREEDIEQVDVPLTDLANVLGSGQADAAVVYEVFREGYFAEHPDSVTLVQSNDLVPTYGFLLAPRSSVEDEAKLAALEDFVGRIARAAEWVRDHPDEWVDAYYVGVMKQTPEAGRSAYEAQGATSWVEVGGDALRDQQAQADLLFANGRLPDEVDLTGQFDPQYATRFTNAITTATKEDNT